MNNAGIYPQLICFIIMMFCIDKFLCHLREDQETERPIKRIPISARREKAIIITLAFCLALTAIFFVIAIRTYQN